MSIEEVNADAGQSFPGEDFAEARRSLGVGFEQLTRELRLPAKTLEAIEAGRLDALGGPVFVRGYIRAYARRLKLDPNRYVAAYDQLLGGKDIRTGVRMVGTVSTTPVKQSRSLMRFGTLVFILAIIGTVVWWWQTQYSIDSVIVTNRDVPVTVDTADGNTLVLPPLIDDEPPAGEARSEGSVELAVSDAEESPEVEGAEEHFPVDGESGETEEPQIMAEEDPEAVSDESSAPVTDSDRMEDMLRISLSDDSWLSVKDASGRSLFNGIAKAGQELELRGGEPLTLVIGRANAVTFIEYGGVPVDIASVSNKNVARLTLPASQH